MLERFKHLHLSLIVMMAIVFSMMMTHRVAAEELLVWVNSEVRREQFAEILKWYQEENPGFEYTLNAIPGDQDRFTERLLLAIVSGSPPDLTWLEGSTVIEFAAQGLLEDVTRALEGIRFTPSDTEEMMFQGKMWGVPYHTTSRGLYKRVDRFLEAGLDPQEDPGSLEALWDWNVKLSDPDSQGGYNRVGLIPWLGNWGAPGWIWTFGGELLDESKSRPTATLPQNIEAFEWIAEWARSYGGVAPVTGGFNGFMEGSVAMSLESTTSAGRFLDAGVDFTTGRVPHPPGGSNGTWGGGQALGVPFNSSNKELAMKVLRYFGDEDVQIRRYEQFPEAFPANWDALQAIVPTLPPAYASLLEQLPEARPRTPLWIDYYVRQLRPQMSAVVAGRITPREALETIQIVMQARFKEVFDQ